MRLLIRACGVIFILCAFNILWSSAQGWIDPSYGVAFILFVTGLVPFYPEIISLVKKLRKK